MSGLLFEYLGVQVPFTQLRVDQFVLLLVLLLSMQLINSMGMRLLIILRGQVLVNYFSFFQPQLSWVQVLPLFYLPLFSIDWILPQS
ncbi:MAG TPA: hypothetical protein ENJ41_04475 [Oceanospirillales bacterium]|nr:hypothetical protein [Oceanospirillales bacterium]